jgi:hypothetical protein
MIIEICALAVAFVRLTDLTTENRNKVGPSRLTQKCNTSRPIIQRTDTARIDD